MSVGPEGGESVAAVVWDHGGRTRLPAGGADLTVLISVLEGLDHADDLINVSADGQVVDAVLAKGALLVDDVSCAECDTGVVTIFDEAAVVSGDLLSDVGDHGDAHGSETTSLPGLHGVLSVSEVGVNGAADHLGVDGLELGALVIKLADLGWAHEGEVERPEEEDDVLAYKIAKRGG